MTKILLPALFLLLLPVLSLKGNELEHFATEIDRDTSLLPYKLHTLQIVDAASDPHAPPVTDRAHVLKVARDSSDGVVITARNQHNNEPAVFSLLNSRTWNGPDVSFGITITGWELYQDTLTSRQAIVGCGFSNDTAWAFKINLDDDSEQRLLLESGEGPSGPGSWRPSIYLCLINDYDFDGHQELFLHLNAGAGKLPRIFYCIDTDSMRLEWALPFAADLTPNQVYSCLDSINPSVLIATMPSGQGLEDSNFSTKYGYLVKLDKRGQIIHKSITSSYPACPLFIEAESPGLFYLTHSLTSGDPDSAREQSPEHYHLSLVDRNAKVLKTTLLDDYPAIMWLQPFGTLSINLHIFHQDRMVRVYDRELQVTARSEALGGTVPVIRYLCTMKFAGMSEPSIVYSAGIFSQDLEQLAAFSYPVSACAPVSLDSLGCAKEFLISTGNRSDLVRLERKGLRELASIFYVNNQKYILMIVTALVVALVIINFNRSRTKRNLALITQQKHEIERSHGEITEKKSALERAYHDLEAATEQIASQRAKQAAAEQYRAASGQFRHEINNALGAVKLYLSNVIHSTAAGGHQAQFLMRYQDLAQRLDGLLAQLPDGNAVLRVELQETLVGLNALNAKLLKGMDEVVLKGVDRALALAERLRKYERIDHDDSRDPTSVCGIINEVVGDHAPVIEGAGITLTCQVSDRAVVYGSTELLAILFGNLLDNSIDALKQKQTGPREICVTSHEFGNTLTIKWKDTGTGIKKESRAKIFEPFYTEKPTTGSGLGLSMVRSIVEKYGGRVEVDSVEGENTTFSLVFERV